MRYLLSIMALGWASLLPAAEPLAADAARVTAAPGVGDALQVVLALGLVLLLIVVSAWFIRRYAGVAHSRNGVLQTLAGISVGQRERIVLVQAGEVQLLLGVAPGSVNTLHVFDKPLQLDAPAGKGGEGFAERLRAAMHGDKGGEA